MDERAQKIIVSALKSFEQVGVRSISVDDICKEQRLSKKTFYQYFPSKEDLVREVLMYRNNLIFDKFDRMCRNKNAIDALIIMIKEIKKTSKHDTNDGNPFLFDLEKYYPAILSHINEIGSDCMRDSFERNLRQGIEEGFYRPDLDVEMSAIFHAIVMKTTFKELKNVFPKITMRRLNDFYIDLIVRLIANDAGLKYIESHIKNDSIDNYKK